MHVLEHLLTHVTTRSAESTSLGAKELHGGTSPTDQYSDFQKLLPRKQKANEKSFPIITSKHIDLESKCSRDYSHILQLLQRPMETHVELQGQRLEKESESQGPLLSITDNSLSYQLQQGITKDDILKKGNRQMCLFLLITHFWRWHTMDSNWNNKMHSNILYCIDYLMVSF